MGWSRRYPSNAHKRADQAFAVRVRVVVPGCGFGKRLDGLHEFLRRRVGREGYAMHTGYKLGVHTSDLYVDDPALAAEAVAMFGLELAPRHE